MKTGRNNFPYPERSRTFYDLIYISRRTISQDKSGRKRTVRTQPENPERFPAVTVTITRRETRPRPFFIAAHVAVVVPRPKPDEETMRRNDDDDDVGRRLLFSSVSLCSLFFCSTGRPKSLRERANDAGRRGRCRGNGSGRMRDSGRRAGVPRHGRASGGRQKQLTMRN